MGAAGGLGLLGAHPLGALAADTVTLPFANGTRPLATYPQKRQLILLTSRPVQLETPMALFDEGVVTPNDAFFVRWHLSVVPTEIDPATFRLKVRGRVRTPLELTLQSLESDFDPVEITAVCQCSGNSRGFFEPRIPGGQWANGAMGNAVWKGARLRDILDKAGIEADAVQVTLNGLDEGPLPEVPDFQKALDIDLARHPDVIVAYRMNGEALPLLNGFPIRLIVPGYFATYWVKMLDDIEVIPKVDDNFWMSKAYRIPADPCGCMTPGQKGVATVPINRMTVRSFVTSLADGATLPAGREATVRGIAFDGGFGIARVLLSVDGGSSWVAAKLGEDHGPYSFRRWQASFTPAAGQRYAIQSLALNTIGQSQRSTPRWNPGGYLRNVVETITVQAS
jgi:DMSO/TMAO reductase YedYZ molybdopterin-dependent catalytic subunit